MKLIIYPILFIFLFAFDLNAQHEELVDQPQHIIALKNGSHLIGVIEAYTTGQPAKIIMGDGSQIIVPHNIIESISPVKQKFRKSRLRQSDVRPYVFDDKRWHHHFDIGIMSNENTINQAALGAFLEFSTTYQIHRLLNVGIGVGFNTYGSNQNNNFLPVQAIVKGYLMPNHTTFFYEVGIGYGFNVDRSMDSEWFIENKRGGLYINPRLGVRLTGHENMNVTIFGGIKIQNSTYEQRWGEDFEELISQKRKYQRLIFGVGFIF